MPTGTPSPVTAAAVSSSTELLPPHPPLRRYYSGEAEHRRRIDGWFDGAAADYDWITQVMSFGFGHWYRRRVPLRAGLRNGLGVLHPGVAALDPSVGMLRPATRRGGRLPLRGLAERLPFPARRFDLLSMGYALRHVADLRASFGEFRRVLRPGGKLLLLEITPPSSRAAFRLLKLYLAGLVPLLARLRGGRGAQVLMEYYWETIERCVPPAGMQGALLPDRAAGRPTRTGAGRLA